MKGRWLDTSARMIESARVLAVTEGRHNARFICADAELHRGILGAAGFADIRFADVHESVYYGSDIDTAVAWVCGFACTADPLKRLDLASSERVLKRLRRILTDHLGNGGVWFDARAWIATARRV